MKIESCEPSTYFFEGDGLTPNNALPLLLYRQLSDGQDSDLAASLEKLFASNNWTNNWRDIIMSRNHYHSSSHEVLGISRGSVTLKLGGHQGREFLVSAGDVIVVPAGVGHFSLESKTDYQVVGGYPDGRDWDMIYDEPNKYLVAKEALRQLPLPKADPIFGIDGPLTHLWR